MTSWSTQVADIPSSRFFYAEAAALIQGDHRFRALGVCPAHERFLKLYGTNVRSQVWLLDTRMPFAACCGLLRRAQMPVILIGPASLDSYVIPGILAGARGYVPQTLPVSHLDRTVDAVLRGYTCGDPEVTARLFSRLTVLHATRKEHKSVAADLSTAEERTLSLVASGMTNREVASALGVSRHTVANHVHSAIRKLRVKTRWDAVDAAGLA